MHRWIREPFDGTLPFYRIVLWIIDEVRGDHGVPEHPITRGERFIGAIDTWWRFSIYTTWPQRFMTWLGPIAARMAMGLIRFTNRSRSNGLAQELRVLANRYDTRPRDMP
jgi:hypothetical protein